MGKRLIIKGADFSNRGIAPVYKRIDWIAMSSTKGQATDSGIPSSFYKEVEYLLSVDASQEPAVAFFGANTQQSAAKCYIQFYASGTIQSNMIGQNTSESGAFPKIADGNVHSFKLSKAGLETDGVLKDASSHVTPAEFSPQTNYALDGAYQPLSGTTADASNIYHIHGVRIYDEGGMVADFIPVKVLKSVGGVEAGTICFYEKVGGTFHVRKGDTHPASSEDK